MHFNQPPNGMNISKKGKNVANPALISSLSLSILAKFPKKINAITKYFKKLSNSKEKKLYAQTLATPSNITREILKIKKSFFKLQDKKIEHIQKIIFRESKLKPYFNMTIKSPLRKQVIVFMNIKNRTSFMKKSSAHVTNINRSLKSIKSDIMADFIYLNNRDIIITTNKVANTLDLQTIEKYIKNINNIESN